MRFKQAWGKSTVLVVAVVAVAVATATAEDGQEEVNERFLARAVVMGTSNPPVIPPGSTATIDIDLDADNVGAGQLAIGVQLEVDSETNTLTVENFGTEPVRLSCVSPRN